MSQISPLHLIVTVSQDCALSEVVEELRRAGLDIEHLLEPIGVVTGFATGANIQLLRKLPGVADVTVDVPIEIGPPTSLL